MYRKDLDHNGIFREWNYIFVVLNDYLIIVAAGVGSRMKTDLPKQFLQLSGKPILLQTLEKFHVYNPQMKIIVVLHPEYHQFWVDLASTLNVTIPHSVISGGTERYDSVRRGLEAIEDENGIVGIHDAVRPLVSFKTIETCYHVARERGNAIPAVEITDTVRTLGGEWIDRSTLRCIQTPQCFEISLIRDAFRQDYHPSFTDDASVLQAAGEALHFVPGNRENIKITTPEDLRMAEGMMRG